MNSPTETFFPELPACINVLALGLAVVLVGCGEEPVKKPGGDSAKVAAEKKAAADKKAADDKAAADKAEADRKAADGKAAADKKASDDKAAADKAEADKKAAGKQDLERLTAERGYCPRGYEIDANPNVRSGTYGYYWFIECNDLNC